MRRRTRHESSFELRPIPPISAARWWSSGSTSVVGRTPTPSGRGSHEEVIREGHAWVGVSAQLIGVMGGPVLVQTNAPGSDNAGLGLRAIDPERYGTLDHPGDGFSFDIYTQVARAIRDGGGMNGLAPDVVVAAGESQSAFALVTYYNGVQPLTEAFDGFFVHSRGGVAMALVGPGEAADLAGAIGSGGPTVFRDDQQAPVLNLQTEGDVTGILGSYAARQPDHDRFRLWEVAGTAHFDQHLLGAERGVYSTAAIRSTTVRSTWSPRPACGHSSPGSRPMSRHRRLRGSSCRAMHNP